MGLPVCRQTVSILFGALILQGGQVHVLAVVCNSVEILDSGKLRVVPRHVLV